MRVGTEKSSGNSAKYILLCAFVVIAIMFISKKLQMQPSEINTGPVSVKFHRIAPATDQAQVQPNAQLEAKIRELEMRIENSRSSPSLVSQGFANIAGLWQSRNLPNVQVQFTQSGAQLAMVVYFSQVATAAGQGYLSDRNLRVDYMNTWWMNGTVQGSISEDGSRLNTVDYPTGFSDVLYRVQ